MNGKFFDLSKEKQDRIMNAALKIFAIYGYRHASTDCMVQEAGISKGLLFHYFENKLGIYSFLYEYSVRFISLELRGTVDPAQTNLFELTKQIELAKMHAMKAYPYMQQFLNRSMVEDVSEALLTIEHMRANLSDTYEEIYAQVDPETLIPGTDMEKIHKILEFTSQGLLQEHFANATFHPENFYKEMEEYIELLRIRFMDHLPR